MKNKSKPFSCLKLMLRTGWTFFFVSAVFVASSYATDLTQPMDRTITGSVTGQDDQMPLVGVSVILKGTQIGTFTDGNGKYSLVIPDQGGQLVLSFVGYTPQTIDIGTKSVLDVELELDQKALDEVIVVGYGTQSRRYVTGSVTKVDMKQTESLPNTNVMQSMRGRVAGVQFTDNARPGQNGSILIRGPRSLSGGNNPLIVLDGIFFNGNLSDINPNDIESMEVLKDASAAAIYGSRAANGVILVTSKKGTTSKPTVRINMYTGISDFSYKVKLLTPDRYIQKVLDYRQAAGLTHNPTDIKNYLTPSEVINYESGNTLDPWDLVSQKGKISSIDFSVSGKRDDVNYYLSTSLTDEKGLMFNDNQKRLSLRANIETEIATWIKAGVSSTFIRRDLSGQASSTPYSVSPFGTAFYEDGEPTQWLVPEDQISNNPIRNALLTTNEEIATNIFANFYTILNIPSLKGLSYRINYSPNLRWGHNYNFFKQDKHFAGNTTSASKFNRQDFDWVLENILTFNKQIDENHGFDITLLYGKNHLGFESTTSNSSQLSSDALGWNDLGLGGILTNTSSAGASDGISSMARLNYRFKDKYLLTLTTRRDGSSVFASNNKYATFPSGSFGWLASEESFLKDVAILDLLKVRASYGAVGNQAISPYQSLSLSGTTRYVYGDGGASSLGVYPLSMANSNLKWETTYTANIGLDFQVFKRRLGGTIEFYNMNTRDLLVRRSLPTMTGYNSVWTNLGATNNKGFELTINSINLQKNNFEWVSDLVFSTNKNSIVHLYQSDTNGDGIEDDDLGNKWFIGQPIEVAYDYIMDGVYQEGDEIPSGFKPGYIRLSDLNNDKKITPSEDRTIVGQMGQPKIRWGITNTFNYKNLSLSVFVNAMQGWIAPLNELDIEYFLPGSGNYPNRPVNRLDADWWTPENKSNTRPSLGYPNPYLHNYYMSRDFVRIQDVSLTYSIPKSIINKAKIGSARMYISGRNLATFTKWMGADPESGGTARAFPVPKSYTLGVNLSF